MLITTDKTPYIVTLLVALVGWAFVYTIGRYTENSIIEYRISRQPVEGFTNAWEITASLTNLSRKASVRDARFFFRRPITPNDTEFLTDPPHEVSTRITYYVPAVAIRADARVAKDIAQFSIPILPPESRVDLTTRYRGVTVPVFLALPTIETGESFTLVEASLFTWVARNDVGIIWGVVVALSLAIITYLSLSRRWGRRPKGQGVDA